MAPRDDGKERRKLGVAQFEAHQDVRSSSTFRTEPRPVRPAEACIARRIEHHEEEFARVWDWLPLSVGVITFPRMLSPSGYDRRSPQLTSTARACAGHRSGPARPNSGSPRTRRCRPPRKTPSRRPPLDHDTPQALIGVVPGRQLVQPVPHRVPDRVQLRPGQRAPRRGLNATAGQGRPCARARSRSPLRTGARGAANGRSRP